MKKTGRNRGKNNINTAKIGVIFIISAMALAGIGVGFAAWTDTVYIEGTVSTGDVDLEVMDYSGTWVYKNLETDEEFTDHAWVSEAIYEQEVNGILVPCTLQLPYMLVAYSYSEYYADDEVTMVYGNLFPCIDFVADILFHYDGSIPIKVNDYGLPDIYGDVDGNWMPGLIGMFNDVPIPDIFVVAFRCDDNGNPIDADGNWLTYDELYENAGNYDAYEIVTIGTQLHKSNWLKLELHIHIPQTYAGEMTEWLMNRDGGFTATIGVVQWNEFPYDGGECGEDPPIGYHADVSLCMDRSGSIVYPLPDHSAIYRTATKAFVDAVLIPDDGMVALSSFASIGSGDHALTIDGAALKGLIDAMSFTGTTNLKEGIEYAHAYLTTEPAGRDDDSTYPDYMVIITDGHPNEPDGTAEADAITAANAAKAHGITIIVLGMGNNVNGPWLETNIASTGYYYAGDWASLEDLLESIVGT